MAITLLGMYRLKFPLDFIAGGDIELVEACDSRNGTIIIIQEAIAW